MGEGEGKGERKGIFSMFGKGKIGKFLKEGEIDVPENPGPGAVGRTPVIGSVRRSMGLKVLRDDVPPIIELEK